MRIKQHIIAATLTLSSIGTQASDAPKSGKIQYDHPRILEMCRYHQNKTGILLDGKEICEYSQNNGASWKIITMISGGVIILLGVSGGTLVHCRKRKKIEKESLRKKEIEREIEKNAQILKEKNRKAKIDIEPSEIISPITNENTKEVPISDIEDTGNIADISYPEMQDTGESLDEESIKGLELDHPEDQKSTGNIYENTLPIKHDLDSIKIQLQGGILTGEALTLAKQDESSNHKIINIPQINAARKHGFAISHNNLDNTILLSAIDPEHNQLYYLDENDNLNYTTEYIHEGVIGLSHLGNGYFQIILPEYKTIKILLTKPIQH